MEIEFCGVMGGGRAGRGRGGWPLLASDDEEEVLALRPSWSCLRSLSAASAKSCCGSGSSWSTEALAVDSDFVSAAAKPGGGLAIKGAVTS
jgi:hypothetical protein